MNQIARVSVETLKQDHWCLLVVFQFENDVGATPLVALNPVDLYLDIFFKGWEVFAYGVAGATGNVPGVTPQLPPNLISYGALDTATIEEGTLALTVVYPDTTIDHFRLQFFLLRLCAQQHRDRCR